ncbi:MAG: hypothetical protein GY720_24075 [bacterium]|nr:hypothetical protein [bacterium]
MAGLRDGFLVLAAILVVVGSIAIVALEFGSASQRRLVGRVRDTVEVLLPPILMSLLAWLVWVEYS